MLQTKETEIIRAGTAKFANVMTGVSKAELWGEPDEAHGSFTRFSAGFSTPRHSHTYDVRMVVISGALIHTDADGIETRLEPGSYCFITGGTKHITSCASDASCLFYEEQPGKFDMNTAR